MPAGSWPSRRRACGLYNAEGREGRRLVRYHRDQARVEQPLPVTTDANGRVYLVWRPDLRPMCIPCSVTRRLRLSRRQRYVDAAVPPKKPKVGNLARDKRECLSAGAPDNHSRYRPIRPERRVRLLDHEVPTPQSELWQSANGQRASVEDLKYLPLASRSSNWRPLLQPDHESDAVCAYLQEAD